MECEVAAEPAGAEVGVHRACCAMVLLAEVLRTTLGRAVAATPSLPGPTRKYRTCGMTILKFTWATALEAVRAVPVSIWDSGTAVSGSSSAAPVIKPLNARCHFTMNSRVRPIVRPSKISTRCRGTLMIISGTAVMGSG